LAAGFIAKGMWKPVMAIYVFMLSAYFIHPFGRWLPLWTILDVLLAFVLVYPAAKLSRNLYGEKNFKLSMSLILLSFIATVMDSLTRIFLPIPAGL